MTIEKRQTRRFRFRNRRTEPQQIGKKRSKTKNKKNLLKLSKNTKTKVRNNNNKFVQEIRKLTGFLRWPHFTINKLNMCIKWSVISHSSKQSQCNDIFVVVVVSFVCSKTTRIQRNDWEESKKKNRNKKSRFECYKIILRCSFACMP